MFGIRPIRTLGILVILFLIFSATRVDSDTKKTDKSLEAKPLSAYMEQKQSPKKTSTPEDALKILHYLFKEKIRDHTMRCRYKKAKSRYFVVCQEGQVLKDSYWEISFKKRGIKLLARSQSALYILDRYPFRELSFDSRKSYPKVEEALKKFFIDN